MIGNGAVIFFIGLLSGYVFLFRLIQEVKLWPIPGSIHIVLPGDERAWRAAHTGNIMNALMLIGIGLSLARIRLTAKAQTFVVWGLIVSAYGNLAFYLLSAMGASGRGLSFGPNRFGGGDLLSIATFLVAYPGALLAPIAMILVARGAFAAAWESWSSESRRDSGESGMSQVQTSEARP